MNELEYRLNTELMRKKKILNIVKVFVIIFFIMFVYLFFEYIKLKNQLALVIVFFSFMISVVFGIMYKNSTMKYIKNSIIEYIIREIFEKKSVKYIQNGIPKKVFDDSRMYGGYNQYYSSDGLKMENDNFYIANVTAIEKDENNKKSVFVGIFGYLQTEEFYSEPIVIKPDVENKYISNLKNSKNKIIGNSTDVVRLENNEFEKYFEVYAKNQIEARQIVTVEYMENLLELKKQMNTLIKIIYIGNKKYVAIWNERIIDEKSIYKKGINLAEIKKRIENIIKVFEEC